VPRPTRQFLDGGLYHVLNRGNGRSRIFYKDRDFLAFLRILAQGAERFGVDVLCWCLMSNHWHLVLRPRRGSDLSRLMQWIGVTHVRRHHSHYHTRGGGHIYQGRFKSFPVQSDEHFLTLCRYVEANPRRARLVKRAELWRWSSLGYATTDGLKAPQSAWPIDRPRGWTRMVNEPINEKELSRLSLSLERGSPFGDDRWSERIAKQTGLSSKLRPLGRPRKIKKSAG